MSLSDRGLTHWLCRVALHIVASPAVDRDIPTGQLILMRQQLNGYPPDDDLKGLVLGVSGDTLLAVTTQAQGKESKRPLSLDLLWQVSYLASQPVSTLERILMGKEDDSTLYCKTRNYAL